MASREQILEAVADENWQMYRKAMKGKATKQKLRMLSYYYDEGLYHYRGLCTYECGLPKKDEQVWMNYQIRIDNYLKALARGGQLYPGVNLKEALDKDWELPIRK